MSRRKHKGHVKTFQQRQAERRQRDAKDEAIVEDMAAKYSCSNGVARDFAGQCEERLIDVDFDLLCSSLALDFWASPPERARPVVDALRELADERQRYKDALTRLRDRLLDFTRSETTHHHLDLPIEYYRHQVRQALFPDLVPPACPIARAHRDRREVSP